MVYLLKSVVNRLLLFNSLCEQLIKQKGIVTVLRRYTSTYVKEYTQKN